MADAGARPGDTATLCGFGPRVPGVIRAIATSLWGYRIMRLERASNASVCSPPHVAFPNSMQRAHTSDVRCQELTWPQVGALKLCCLRETIAGLVYEI